MPFAEKPSRSAAASFSFENMLGWFGRFTPQFKLRLLMLTRRLRPEEIETRMKELFEVYRVVLFDLSRQPKGSLRALRALELMDQELATVDMKDVKCGKACNACCRLFPKQITDDEAELLADTVVSGGVEIDRARLEAQARELEEAAADQRLSTAKQACVFLGAEGECRVYAARPGVCRKYHVVSAPSECEKENGEVVPKIDILPEMIQSALLSVPETRVDWMPLLLREAIQRRLSAQEAASAVRFQMPDDLEIIDAPPTPTGEAEAV